MALSDLLNKFKKNMPAAQKETDDMVNSTLPSDEDLNRSKADRHKAADDVTDYLATKGYPTLGAVAGTVTDLTADLIPSTRDEYKEGLVGGGTAGTVSKTGSTLGKMAMPEVKAAANSALKKLPSEVLKDVGSATKGAVTSSSTKMSDELSHAVRNDPELLRKIQGVENVAEAEKILAQHNADKLKDIQLTKDVKAGIKKPGSTTVNSDPFEAGTAYQKAPRDTSKDFNPHTKPGTEVKQLPDSGYTYNYKTGKMEKR